jgi:hypothetical protein
MQVLKHIVSVKRLMLRCISCIPLMVRVLPACLATLEEDSAHQWSQGKTMISHDYQLLVKAQVM